jgi:hypothetical protein
MSEAKINYRDVQLRCEYQLEPYNEQPVEGGYMYDLFIYVQETEISEIFEHDQLLEIEKIIYAKIHENEL